MCHTIRACEVRAQSDISAEMLWRGRRKEGSKKRKEGYRQEERKERRLLEGGM